MEFSENAVTGENVVGWFQELQRALSLSTTQSDNKILKVSEDLGMVQQSVAELSAVAIQVGRVESSISDIREVVAELTRVQMCMKQDQEEQEREERWKGQEEVKVFGGPSRGGKGAVAGCSSV